LVTIRFNEIFSDTTIFVYTCQNSTTYYSSKVFGFFLRAYLGEFNERHVVVKEKILEHLRAAHLGCWSDRSLWKGVAWKAVRYVAIGDRVLTATSDWSTKQAAGLKTDHWMKELWAAACSRSAPISSSSIATDPVASRGAWFYTIGQAQTFNRFRKRITRW